MNPEISGIAFSYFLALAVSVPLGRYIGRVLTPEVTFADRLFNPVDRIIFRLSGIDPSVQMNWKESLRAMLTLNLLWFVLSMLVLTNMEWLPLNPDGNPSMSAELAFNTSVSFVTNTNLQHYSGETGLSYLGQMMLMLWQFISASTGIAVFAVLIASMKEQTSDTQGNFYFYFVRSCTRILLPLSLILALILLWRGVPMTFEGTDTVETIEGSAQNISMGPVAAIVAIKQLGTNGGGFYGTNSAHPLENPDYVSNIAESVSILLIPVSMVFAAGYVLKRKKFARMVFGVMTTGYLLLLIPSVVSEMNGNPEIGRMGIDQFSGSMEGKEVRFGSAYSAFWAVNTTCTSNGSVNAMHDSLTPVTGMQAMLGMMVNCFYGGVGVGFLNFYIFMILAVFIGGLMVGRTPEFLGKKIEAREVKISMIVALLHPLLILAGTGISSYLYSNNPEELGGWLNNPGHHGFSEMLYEFCSASANNGSGFEGLGDNTPFWNIATGIIMLIARYIPIIGPVSIAGMLASKKYIPESSGTLKTGSATFGILVFAVIVIVAALSFFPALTIGPLSEYISSL